jgi:hypothetical protein
MNRFWRRSGDIPGYFRTRHVVSTVFRNGLPHSTAPSRQPVPQGGFTRIERQRGTAGIRVITVI